jgi:hypothetical protein
MRKGFLIVVAVLFITADVSADQVAALLRVKRSEQPDSLGFNLVEQLSKITYQLILQNKIKLWDSPSKEIQITATSLQEIEQVSSTSFKDQEVIYIYESWNEAKREIQTKTIGISFSNRDSRNQEVSYGYVDYADLARFLIEKPAEVNANGNFGETPAFYLTTKKFNFSLVQFNNKVIQSADESQKTLKSYMGRSRFAVPQSGFSVEESKNIVYVVDRKPGGDTLLSGNSDRFYSAVENYLLSNKEEFFNLGGDKVQNFVSGKQSLRVTAIEVNELWKKNNGQVSYEPKSIRFYVNDSALNIISLAEMTMMELEINGQKLVLTLLDKKFNFTITKINSQEIALRQAFIYLKALREYHWNQLTEFVKYY